MPQFMKKAFVGMVTAGGGASDPELAEVRLTAAEYNDLCKRICSAEDTAAYEKNKAMNDIEAAKRAADQKVAAACKSANQQLEEFKKELKEKCAALIGQAENAKNQALMELEKQKNLNDNLKRIARERANQDRKIPRKKDHDGYLVLESCQWQERYKYQFSDQEYAELDKKIKDRYPDGYFEIRTADVWKSVLQTPYNASIPIEQIKEQIEDADLWDSGVLGSIGCQGMNANEYNGSYSQEVDENGHEINSVYKWIFKANYKSGFWEVIIYTTKSLTVPEHRRPYLNRHYRKMKSSGDV